MKTSIICLFALSSAFVNASVLADESGSGKPSSDNATTSASTDTTTTECSILETWLGLCGVESEERTY